MLLLSHSHMSFSQEVSHQLQQPNILTIILCCNNFFSLVYGTSRIGKYVCMYVISGNFLIFTLYFFLYNDEFRASSYFLFTYKKNHYFSLCFFFFWKYFMYTLFIMVFFYFSVVVFQTIKYFIALLYTKKKITKRNSQTLNLSDRPKIPDLLIFQSCSLCCLLYFLCFFFG